MIVLTVIESLLTSPTIITRVFLLAYVFSLIIMLIRGRRT